MCSEKEADSKSQVRELSCNVYVSQKMYDWLGPGCSES